MIIFKKISSVRRLGRPVVVTIGVFDGVHLGHQRLIKTAVRLAKSIKGKSLAVTFDPDPSKVIHPSRKHFSILPVNERLGLIGKLGIDAAYVIKFTRKFASLSAARFMKEILFGHIRPSAIVVGKNFFFGRDRSGDFKMLSASSKKLGMKVVSLHSVYKLGKPVSSSRIRGLIREGRIGRANSLLGRPFMIFGKVVHGDGRGVRLGFPTANIHLNEDAIAPFGVYKVEVEIDGDMLKGAMNIGLRPTFKSKSKRPTAEVFIFGFNKRIYGKKIAIRLIKLLRLERRFKNSKALISQIRKDVLRCGFKANS